MTLPDLPVYYDLYEFKENYIDAFAGYDKSYIMFLRDYLKVYCDIMDEYNAMYELHNSIMRKFAAMLAEHSGVKGESRRFTGLQNLKYEINKQIAEAEKINQKREIEEWESYQTKNSISISDPDDQSTIGEWIDYFTHYSKFQQESTYLSLSKQRLKETQGKYENSVFPIINYIEEEILKEEANIRAGKATQESDLQHHKFKSEFTFPEIMALLHEFKFLVTLKANGYNKGQIEQLIADMFGRDIKSARTNIKMCSSENEKIAKQQKERVSDYLSKLRSMKSKDIRVKKTD